MAILADGSSHLDRYVEGAIEAEGFAASCRLLFLHLTQSGPRRALAIIWNVQSDWQRDDAVETRGSPREEAAGTQQMRSRVPFALRTVQSFFCRAEKESLTGRALVPLGISQRKVRGGYRKPTGRALPWRRFTICSARFRTTMPMS